MNEKQASITFVEISTRGTELTQTRQVAVSKVSEAVSALVSNMKRVLAVVVL